MITYEVVQDVEPGLAEALERYMLLTHIPAVLATGCFVAADYERADGAGLARVRLRTRYQAATRADLDRYLAGPTAALREDFNRHFPEGVTLGREVWETRPREDRGAPR